MLQHMPESNQVKGSDVVRHLREIPGPHRQAVCLARVGRRFFVGFDAEHFKSTGA